MASTSYFADAEPVGGDWGIIEKPIADDALPQAIVGTYRAGSATRMGTLTISLIVAVCIICLLTR